MCIRVLFRLWSYSFSCCDGGGHLSSFSSDFGGSGGHGVVGGVPTLTVPVLWGCGWYPVAAGFFSFDEVCVLFPL
jgi:hypothetical protein